MHQEWLPGIEQEKLIRKSFDIATALASHLSLKFEQVCCTSTKDQGGFWCEPHLHQVSERKELRNKSPVRGECHETRTQTQGVSMSWTLNRDVG